MVRLTPAFLGLLAIATTPQGATAFTTTSLWQRPKLHSRQKTSPVLLVSTSSDVNGSGVANATESKPATASSDSNEWVGGFIEAHPELNYPETKPDLSSLGPMTGNHDNIDKLDRMQKVRWPEFSWLRDQGDPSSRLYIKFFDDISRIGYTKEGRVYSIICPQMGYDLSRVGLPGTFNIEVHVGHTRGWVDENTRTICGDMTVTGKIWIDMTDEEKENHPFVAAMQQSLSENNATFPFTKATALTVPTHVPNKPYTNTIPVLNGTASEFMTPDFTQHWDDTFPIGNGERTKCFSVGNVVCQVAPHPKTGNRAVDDFNDILMELQSIGLGGILAPGSIISWNVWFTEPEPVDQEEWTEHSEIFRESVANKNKQNLLLPGEMRDYAGNYIYRRILVKDIIQYMDLFKKIKNFQQNFHPKKRFPIAFRNMRRDLYQNALRVIFQALMSSLVQTAKRLYRTLMTTKLMKPVKAFDRFLGRVAGTILGANKEVIPGIRLPRAGLTSTFYRLFKLNRKTMGGVVIYFLRKPRLIRGITFSPRNGILPDTISLRPMIGKKKTQESLDWFKGYITKLNKLYKSTPELPDDYTYWPDPENSAEELITCLKSNPFYSSAITKAAGGDGFEVKSYDPSYDEKTNGTSQNWFIRFINTMPNSNAGRRVNIKFDSKMTEITSFEIFDDAGRSTTYDAKDPSNKAKLRDAVEITLFNLLFSASAVHTTFHIVHALMVQCLAQTSRHFEDMSKYARWYNADLVVLYYLQDLIVNRILSKGKGFCAVSEKLHPLMTELINSWGSEPRNYIKNMFSLTKEEMLDAGILTEFFKHYNLIDDYVIEVADSIKSVDPVRYDRVERDMTDKLKTECGGFVSNIDTFQDWLTLMSVTGLIHGGTHSAVRYYSSPHIMKWLNPEKDVWTKDDMNIIGAYGFFPENDPDRNNMSEAVKAGRLYPNFARTLRKYNNLSVKKKKKYQEELIKDPRFKKLGFILSDYCTDNFDLKQLSNAAYN